jgi:hypothetical protein
MILELIHTQFGYASYGSHITGQSIEYLFFARGLVVFKTGDKAGQTLESRHYSLLTYINNIRVAPWHCTAPLHTALTAVATVHIGNSTEYNSQHPWLFPVMAAVDGATWNQGSLCWRDHQRFSIMCNDSWFSVLYFSVRRPTVDRSGQLLLVSPAGSTGTHLRRTINFWISLCVLYWVRGKQKLVESLDILHHL